MIAAPPPQTAASIVRQALHLAAWALVSYAAWFMARASLQYVLGDPEAFQPWFRDRYLTELPLVRLHGVCGCLVLAIGCLQFSGWLRCARPVVHRILGYLYVSALTLAAPTALILAIRSPGGFAPSFSVAVLVSLWLVSGWRAVAAARAGDMGTHRAWMIRCYALTFITVTCRLYLYQLECLGIEFGLANYWVTCFGWLPNLLAAEVYLRLVPLRQGNSLP